MQVFKGTDMRKFKQNGIWNSAFGTCCVQVQILKIKHYLYSDKTQPEHSTKIVIVILKGKNLNT